MNIHEYQAKEQPNTSGGSIRTRVSDGGTGRGAKGRRGPFYDCHQGADSLESRGEHFQSGFQGGVHLSRNLETPAQIDPCWVKF